MGGGEIWEWMLEWHRDCFDWEKPSLEQLYEDLNLMSMQRDQPNKCEWPIEAKWIYSTKSTYKSLQVGNGKEQSDDTWFIWNTNLPPKVVVMIWRVMLDRLPTRTNLLKRCVVGTERSIVPFLPREIEVNWTFVISVSKGSVVVGAML